MLKKYVTYCFCLGLTVLFFASCRTGSSRKSLPDLRETYSRKDKIPFGTNIAFRQLESLYPLNNIRSVRQPFAQTWKQVSDTSSLYICIANQLLLSQEDVDAMLEFVREGNDLFISAMAVDEVLQERIQCKINDTTPLFMGLADLRTTSTRLRVEPDTSMEYFYFPFRSYFSRIDSTTTRVLGYNDRGEPNAIVYFHGKGKLFLHCDPRAFSNYFLLKKENYKYVQQSLAFTQTLPQRLYWDDYYYKAKSRSPENFSTFSEIMKHPPLKYAFWIAMVLLGLFLLFGGKRLQRIIEERKPNVNTTVAFTETIGRLYLQKKDNRNIADKMITYFNEFIRNKYFLNTSVINEDFITNLGRKSGVPREQVASLYKNIAEAQASGFVDDYRLLALNQQIQHFHKTKN